MPKFIIVKPGDKYGRLEIIRESDPSPRGDRKFECRCLCTLGTIRIVWFSGLQSGQTQSCGCLQKERTSQARITHGKRHTVEFETWSRMRQRCYNLNHPNYKDYGGRGITVCDRWLDSFENFYADMRDRPSAKHTIERKNNDLGYSPDNCKWATRDEQGRNKRNVVWIEYHGERRRLRDVCEEIGFRFPVANGRRNRGFPEDKLFDPPKKDEMIARCTANAK